jgi:hypothetical protein
MWLQFQCSLKDWIFRVSWNLRAFPFSELVRVSCLKAAGVLTTQAYLRKLLFCQVIRPLQADAHFIHAFSDVNAKRNTAHTADITKLMKRLPLHTMKQLNF